MSAPHGLSESRAMFLENAAVHHDEYPRLAGFLSGVLVNHFFLHPDRRNSHLNRMVDDLFHKFRPAEDINDIDLLRYIEQRGEGLLTETLLDSRVYRDDAVSVSLHVGANAVARTQWVAGEADHRDGPGTLEKFGDRVRLCQGSAAYFLAAWSSFCLYIFSANLRTVSETSLLPEMFFKSAINRCFIRPSPRSSGVRGFATRFRTTL